MVSDRLKDLKKHLNGSKLDVAIFYKTDTIDEKSIYYLTGLKFNPGILFVFPKRKPILFVSPLDKLDKKELSLLEGITVKILDGKTSIYSVLNSETSIGVNESILPKKFHSVIKKSIKKEKGYLPKLVNCDLVAGMRLVKYSDEVDKTVKAIEITESIFEKVFLKLKKKGFKYESEIVKFLRVETINAGCELAFDPVVASGKNSSNPHYYPDPESRLRRGFCIIDFGVKFEGYCADITRTVYFGTPSKTDLVEYRSVVNGLNYAESNLEPGIVMEKYFLGFMKNNFSMIHALGHGIGLDIHEFPAISKSSEKAQIGNVVAIEPAKYVKGKFGIRVEDDFIVTENGVRCLCTLSRKLISFKL